MPILNQPRLFKLTSVALPLLACALHALPVQAGLVDVRAILAKAKADSEAKKAAAANESAAASSANPGTGAATAASLPASGEYNGNNNLFERTLEIKPDGRFTLEVLEKGNTGHSRSGSGAGKLEAVPAGWQFVESRCQLHLTPLKDGLMMRVDGCLAWGDVMFNGRYQLAKAGAAASPAKVTMPGSATASLNPKLAQQFNCQGLDMSDKGVEIWLAQMAGITPDKVWDTPLKVNGYSFQGLPISAVRLTESDGGSMVMVVNGTPLAVNAAIKKSNSKKNTSVAWLRKVGDPGHFEGFAGSAPGINYVQCSFKNAYLG